MDKKEKMYCVYKHTNKFNNKVYVGITSQQPEKRWKNGHGYECNEYFYRAIQKYGWDDGFTHEIVIDGLYKDQACAIEIELIKAYSSTNPDYGYNFSTGGDCGNSGCAFSEEWKQQVSDAIGKPVICLESGVVYKTAKSAEKATGIKASRIGAVCRCDYGHRTAGGLHWCFWDSEWIEFKSMCDELGFVYIQCVKCGNLIIKGNFKPKKYCSMCSGRQPSCIKKSSKICKKSHRTQNKRTRGGRKPMGKRSTTK